MMSSTSIPPCALAATTAASGVRAGTEAPSRNPNLTPYTQQNTYQATQPVLSTASIPSASQGAERRSRAKLSVARGPTRHGDHVSPNSMGRDGPSGACAQDRASFQHRMTLEDRAKTSSTANDPGRDERRAPLLTQALAPDLQAPSMAVPPSQTASPILPTDQLLPTHPEIARGGPNVVWRPSGRLSPALMRALGTIRLIRSGQLSVPYNVFDTPLCEEPIRTRITAPAVPETTPIPQGEPMDDDTSQLCQLSTQLPQSNHPQPALPDTLDFQQTNTPASLETAAGKGSLLAPDRLDPAPSQLLNRSTHLPGAADAHDHQFPSAISTISSLHAFPQRTMDTELDAVRNSLAHGQGIHGLSPCDCQTPKPDWVRFTAGVTMMMMLCIAPTLQGHTTGLDPGNVSYWTSHDEPGAHQETSQRRSRASLALKKTWAILIQHLGMPPGFWRLSPHPPWPCMANPPKHRATLHTRGWHMSSSGRWHQSASRSACAPASCSGDSRLNSLSRQP